MKLKKFIHLKYALLGFGFVAMALVQSTLVGCQQMAQSSPTVPSNETSNPVLPDREPETAPTPPSTDKKTVAYRIVRTDDGAHLEPVEVTASGDDTETAIAALNLMAKMKDSPLPEGTKVRSVKFSQDLATVDFNRSFEDNFSGGDEREALMLNAITATLGQFPHIQRVQVLVDGEKKQMGGLQDLMQPLEVAPSVTRISQKPPESRESGQR